MVSGVSTLDSSIAIELEAVTSLLKDALNTVSPIATSLQLFNEFEAFRDSLEKVKRDARELKAKTKNARKLLTEDVRKAAALGRVQADYGKQTGGPVTGFGEYFSSYHEFAVTTLERFFGTFCIAHDVRCPEWVYDLNLKEHVGNICGYQEYYSLPEDQHAEYYRAVHANMLHFQAHSARNLIAFLETELAALSSVLSPRSTSSCSTPVPDSDSKNVEMRSGPGFSVEPDRPRHEVTPSAAGLPGELDNSNQTSQGLDVPLSPSNRTGKDQVICARKSAMAGSGVEEELSKRLFSEDVKRNSGDERKSISDRQLTAPAQSAPNSLPSMRKRLKRFFEYLQKNPEPTYDDIVNDLSMARQTVRKYMIELKELKVVHQRSDKSWSLHPQFRQDCNLKQREVTGT